MCVFDGVSVILEAYGDDEERRDKCNRQKKNRKFQFYRHIKAVPNNMNKIAVGQAIAEPCPCIKW